MTPRLGRMGYSPITAMAPSRHYNLFWKSKLRHTASRDLREPHPWADRKNLR